MPRFLRLGLLTAFGVFFLSTASQAINYYTYTSAATSGAWNDASTWTTDPSGITSTGSAVPANGDAVFILNGFTVFLSANVATTGHSVTINNGGTLDLATFTITTLTALNGSGALRISAGYFPTVTTNNFVNNAASGATVEYANFTGTVPASLNFPNLRFTNASGNNTITVSNSAAYTMNVYGTFTTDATGGTLTVTMGSQVTNIINLVIGADVTIGANTTWNTGVFTGASVHAVSVSGNLTNNGTVIFNNNAATQSSANTGSATLKFVGTTNTVLACNNTTRLHTLEVDKGTSSTYILSVTSTNVANFSLWSGTSGYILLVVTNGTLRLGSNILLTQLRNSGNYDLGALAGTSPMLWIDGADVTSNSALVVYGKFRITAGTFTASGGEGAVIRDEGQYLIEGGTFNTPKFRPSNTALSHRGSFIMTGGVFNAIGSSSNGAFARFSHPYAEQVFIMTGGTINVQNTGAGVFAGLHIGVKESNYTVTGGTVNVILAGTTSDFKILSTAPLYDLNISKTGGTLSTVILDNMPNSGDASSVFATAQPLRILNNLTIDGSLATTLNANGKDVSVGGNFTITAGATYTPNGNTTIFNGTAAQQFNNSGTITGGLYNMTVSKPSGTLTLGGSVSSYSVTNNLTLSAGVLNDGGKTVQVTGNISNSATHTGTGSITLSGTSTQTLSGDGNGVYGNVILNNNDNPGALASANLSISGTLTLEGMGNSIFDINQYRLTMTSGSATALTTTGNGFSNVKMIRTLGLQSDGGLRKTFGNLSAFTFAVGAGANYTPAVIQLTATPTSYGSITVKPVNSRNPFVVAGNINNLTWYWNVTSNAFVGATTFTHRYYYDEGSALPTGDDATYIPARYTPTTWTTISDLTQVNETTNEITFAGVNYIDGDFTAGRPSAFGTVKVFYSKRNGDWFNVGAGTTPWSNVSHSGADATTAPGPGDHVYIGDGTTYNHTVTVGTDNASCGGLEISAGSTLDVGITTGHYFGALEDEPVGGNGTLRISSNTATAQFPAGDFGNFIRATGGTVIYYTTGGQNFTIPLQSASPTLLPLITYRNLILEPAAASAITLPNQDMQVFNNMTVQGGALSGTALFNGAAARSFLVNGNLAINGGTLQFQNGTAQAADVDGSITVSAGAAFNVAATGTIVANTLTVGGSLTNNGSFDMNNTSRVCNVTFDGAANASVTGTGGTTDFNVLTVSKGTSIASVLEVNASAFTLSGGAAPLVLNAGTFRLTSAQSVTIANGSDFNVPANARLSANGGTLRTTGGNTIDLLLAGTLEVLSGTIDVGTTTNDNAIEYASTGLPAINITGGTLNVRGQVRRSTANAQGTLVYSQSGGTVNVGISVAGATTRALFELFGTGSSFTMSAGTLNLQRRVGNAAATTIELFLQPTAGNVTGGTVQTGHSGVSTNVIDINTTVPLFNLSVVGNTNTANLLSSALTLRGSLSIASSCVFAANSLNVSIAGNFTNSNTDSGTGVSAGGYRAGSVSQTTTFNSTSGHQSISGVSGNLSNFGNLVINNTFSGGIVTLQPNSDLLVNGNLTLASGTLAGVANTITALGTVSNSSTHTSTTGSITLASNSMQLVTGNGAGRFGNVMLNSGGTYFGADQEVTGTLTFNGAQLMIGSYRLNLSNTSFTAIVGANTSTAYITTSGNLSDAGVTKAFAASASGTFVFPVGVGSKYTPASYTITTGSPGGTITVRPVNSKHPSATGSGTAYIRYYWNVVTSGIAVSSLTHHYTYAAADENGLNTDYRDARFTGGAWVVGSTANVNTTTRVITFTNSTNITSDYTAGEPTAFVNPTTYTSIGNGPWESDVAVWTPDPPGTNLGPPPGSFIVISAGTTVTVNQNAMSMATMSLQGRLNLGTTTSHNFGTITTTGVGERTLQLGSSFFPAGDFTAFNAATGPTTGGTVEYNGAVTLSATQATYNNLTFTGTGAKVLGNVDLTVNGSVTISAGTVNNPANRSITMTSTTGDFTNNGTFNAGSGSVTVGRDLINSGGGAAFNAPNSTTGLKIMRNLTNSAGATFTAGTDSIGVRGTLSNAGTFAAGANVIHIQGNLSNTGGTFTGGNGAISANGSLTNNAAFSAGSGAITILGGLVNSGAGATYNANANSLSVGGSVNLAVSSVFNAGTGSITTLGHWNNSATFNAGTGTVSFSGVSNQDINGATTFHNVTRAGANLTLNNDVTIGGLLTLSAGNIVTGSNVLSLTNPSTQPVVGYSTSAYVDGALSITFPNTASESRIYPIASGGAYRPVTIQQTAASTDPVVRVRMTNTPPTGAAPTGVDRLSHARYYQIDRTSGTINDPVITLSFNTNGTPDETIATPANARVIRSATAPSGPWTNEGGSGVFSPADPAGYVTSDATSIGATTFFTLGYPNEITPVTLVSFEAVLNSDLVDLMWSTASEINNHYFTIERSDESLQFDSLFTVDGAGDSQLLLNYSAVDYSPLQGISFYRLKQTDFDLKYSYSKVVRVVNNQPSAQLLSLYPNPVRENEGVYLKTTAAKAEKSNVTITDALGRLYFSGIVDLSHTLDLRDLALQYSLSSGTYLIRVAWGGHVQTRKLVIY